MTDVSMSVSLFLSMAALLRWQGRDSTETRGAG